MRLPAVTALGQGSTAVLLLHGIGGGRSIWGREGSGTTQAIAAAGYRALAVDLPGYGDSAPMGAPDLAALVAAVRALVADVGADAGAARTVLLGHSMGGMVALELAVVAPQRLAALVLACTSPAFGRADGDWQARFVAERLAPLDTGLGMPGLAARLVPSMVGPSADANATGLATRVMSEVPEATYRSVLEAIVAFDRRSALPGIRVPTLCLAGGLDRQAPVDVMQRMAGRMPDARLVALAAAGHLANLEQPAAFDAAVLDFLQETLR